MKKFTQMYSATVLGTGNNNGINLLSDKEYVFKSYYKLRTDGQNRYTLFFVNSVDSTGNCKAGKKGDGYIVTKAYAAFSPDKEQEENITPITFDSKVEKIVSVGEEYESDAFDFTYKKDGYLVLCFNVKTNGRVFLPATNESASTGRMFVDGEEKWCDNFVLRPAFIGCDKPMTKTVGFWGDSITQGTRTGIDKYEAWSHRIGSSMPDYISFWNIGMGWARGYDASLGGVFTQKAAMCDEVFMCFGVNDIRSGGRSADELIEDLEKAKALLKEQNNNIKVHFMTVPPFNMSEYEEAQRKRVNEYIKQTAGFFDIAACLECDAVGSVKSEYMASSDDAHPNGDGGKAVYEGFLKWQEKNKW